jgi:TPR repeat protein
VEKDILKAYDLYEESAKKGNAQSMSNLGYLYYKRAKNTGSDEMYLEAAHWFRYSISEDDRLKDSNYYLGCMHLAGEGVDRSHTLAFRGFKSAADNGHDSACAKIGDL